MKWVRSFLFVTFFVMIFTQAGFTQIDETLRGMIRGQVLDESTQSPLVAVNILLERTQMGTAADDQGLYSIDHVPPGIYNMRFMMMGYETRVINNVVVNPGRTTWQQIEMKSTVLEGEGVVVTAGYFSEAKDAVVSNRRVDYEEIRMDPGSAEDLQRVMQVLPAVVSGADQDNEIIVRGGMPGENLFVMDHIEIPNPNHFGDQGVGGGPINMLNAHFVRNIDFYAGAFPARYGDKASSVMDISLRDGDRERITGHGYLGMSGAGLIIEGPIQGGRGAYIISGRKSFLDLIISSTGLTAVPKYYNFQGRIVYDINPSHQLIMNGIYGDDKITIRDEEEESGYQRGVENVRSWSHQYALGLTWRALIGQKGFSRVTLSQALNHWDQEVWDENDKIYYTNLSTEIERTFKVDLTYQFSKQIELNIGGNLKSIPFNIHQWADKDTLFTYDTSVDPPQQIGIYQNYDEYKHDHDLTTLKAALFGQIKWTPHSRITCNFGLRGDYFDYTSQTAIDPRLGFSLALNANTHINLALGQHSQAPSYIQISEHPLNKDLQYKYTQQIVLGFERLFREDIRGTVEIFYKDYRHVPIRSAQTTPDPFDSSNGRLLSQGKGFAKGVEFFLQKKLTGNYHFTISYAYSVSMGYDPRYHRTFHWDYDYGHVFTFVSGLHFNLIHRSWYQRMTQNFFYKIFGWLLPFADQVEIGIRWRYLGGRPYTQPLYYPQLQKWFVDETVPYNAERYPVYHRLDFRLDKRYMMSGWNMVFYLDIINIYGRDNIWMYSYQENGTKKEILQFQVFPVGGITIEF
ncbi:TonB-dependent receptor [bacterium]|nr:TonB-dependent receptor [bacterium]RQV98966.1 MAG: TonB-dependent receptor [bacterium]